MDNPPWSGFFKLWFMSNPFERAIAGFSKSSHTQRIGAPELSGKKVDIIVADSAMSDNDGDLANNGVCLRKPGLKAVCYPDAARLGVNIDGRQLAINVRYRCSGGKPSSRGPPSRPDTSTTPSFPRRRESSVFEFICGTG